MFHYPGLFRVFVGGFVWEELTRPDGTDTSKAQEDADLQTRNDSYHLLALFRPWPPLTTDEIRFSLTAHGPTLGIYSTQHSCGHTETDNTKTR